MDGLLNTGEYATKCTPCPAGLACDTLGLASYPVKPCQAGFFCSVGAPHARPVCSDASCLTMYGICPTDFFCPVGSRNATRCLEGYYTRSPGSAACEPCPVGFFSDAAAKLRFANAQSSESYEVCPQGRYCPEATGIPFLCPVGRYGNATGLGALEDCSLCDAGSFCGVVGLSQPQGLCQVNALLSLPCLTRLI